MKSGKATILSDENEVEIENENSELEEMRKTLELLKMQLSMLQEKAGNSQVQGDKHEEIKPDRYVKLMSGINQILNLSRGVGKEPLTFKSFGEIKRVTYAQLLEILDKKEDFYRKGYFFILDKEIVDHLGYADLVALTPEQINYVIDNTCATDNAMDLYRQATDAQKAIIVDFLIGLIRDGKEVNMNLVYAIERESKVEITKEAERAKEYMELGVP